VTLSSVCTGYPRQMRNCVHRRPPRDGSANGLTTAKTVIDVLLAATEGGRGPMACVRLAPALSRVRRGQWRRGWPILRPKRPRTGLVAGTPPALHFTNQRQSSDLLDAPLSIFPTRPRRGNSTYHGPGQRVAYVMLTSRRGGRRAGLCGELSKNGSSGPGFLQRSAARR